MGNDMIRIKRAILSVSDKIGLIPLARTLQSFGCEIISTGGTRKVLEEAGIKVIDITNITGRPEAFGGRMKTISFNIESALLFDRERDREEAEKLGIKPIDMVVCNLYPFKKFLDAGVDLDTLIEHIDVGGHTLIRAGAKNSKYVAVVSDISDYPTIIEELKANNGALSYKTRIRLMRKAFNNIADYDSMIALSMDELAGEMSSYNRPMIDPSKSAVVVIDMQKDFVCSGGLLDRAGRDIARKQKILKELPSFLKEARSHRVPIIFVQSFYGPRYLNAPLRKKFDVQLGKESVLDSLCIEGRDGANLAPELRLQSTDYLIRKHTHSAFIHTELPATLSAISVTQVVLVGVESNGCVESTARDASALGYFAFVVKDLIHGSHNDLHNACLKNIHRYFGWVVSSDEVIADWKKSATE